MYIYVDGIDIISVAENNVLDIEGAESFLVEKIPTRVYECDFVDGEFVRNTKKEEKEKERQLELQKDLIVQDYERKMQKLVGGYSKSERDTWDIQQYEAGQYLQTEDESLAPLLSEVLLGEVEGTTLKELCERVLAKAEPSKRMAGRLLAEKNRKLRELEEVKA